jgi:high-affinity iron transporter
MISTAPRRHYWIRRSLLIVLTVVGTFVAASGQSSAAAGGAFSNAPRATLDCKTGSVSKSESIAQLRQLRASIDRSLRLLDSGQRDAAFEEAKSGYLQCFESVEAPLDVAAGIEFRFKVENAFARVRVLINDGAPTGEIRDRIVILRGLIDETERKLTATGVSAPLLVFGQSFTLLLREGLEAVLLLAALFGYLQTTEQGDKYKRPILYGVGVAIAATVVAYFAVDAIFSALPFGREVLEAIVGLFAVVVLFYVSFWLAARLEQRRWLEFLRARVWKAVSIGSTTSLALIGFTSVFREGFETVLFYQAMLSFSSGLKQWVLLGVAAAVVVLAGVAWAVLKLGRVLPVRTFLAVAVIVVMATSIALVGNAMRALQESAIIDVHFLDGWPNLPIFLAQATGYYPTVPSILAQAALTLIYVVGGAYTFVIAPRRRRRLELASA